MANKATRNIQPLNIPDWLKIPLIFLLARMLLVMGLPLEGLQGYGDVINFYNNAALPGWPFFGYWVEFPPIFPFISEILYQLANGQPHVYTYLFIFSLSAIDAGSLAIFQNLTTRLDRPADRAPLVWGYALILVVLPYSWGYFDPMAVLFVLLAIWTWNKERPGLAGIALTAGILTKLFPAALIPGLWLQGKRRAALIATSLAVGLPLLAYFALYIASPEMTSAGLASQGSKGSWETAWALLDGNLDTGNFGPLAGRLDPQTAYQPMGRPAIIPPWLSILPFGLAGLWVTLRHSVDSLERWIAYIGLTLCLLWLWSPGWSPQWVLYLLPLILLALPARRAWLFVALLLLVNLAEWPVLLSRGLFWGLWLTVPLRTVILGLLGWSFFQSLRGEKSPEGQLA